MKEFSCRKGHQFDSCDVKECMNERPVCPECWPDGYREYAAQMIYRPLAEFIMSHPKDKLAEKLCEDTQIFDAKD